MVDRKPEVVQIDQDQVKRENWNKMISGLKLETEQALHLAMLKMDSGQAGEELGPRQANGLIIDGEALLVPNRIVGFGQTTSALDWEMTLGFPQLVNLIDQKEINFFVFCQTKRFCPLIKEKMITMGLSPKRLSVFHSGDRRFKNKLTGWLKTHAQYLFVGDDLNDIKKIISKLDGRQFSKNLKSKWLRNNIVNLPDAQSRVAKWHEQSRL